MRRGGGRAGRPAAQALTDCRRCGSNSAAETLDLNSGWKCALKRIRADDFASRSQPQSLGRAGAPERSFTRPAADDEFGDPLRAVNVAGWLGSTIAGKSVLCLAAGGGRHGAVYAAAGAG